MHLRLSGLSTYGLSGYRKGDEHPAYASEGHGTLYLYFFCHQKHCKTYLFGSGLSPTLKVHGHKN